jgi:hypothetical protein
MYAADRHFARVSSNFISKPGNLIIAIYVDVQLAPRMCATNSPGSLVNSSASLTRGPSHPSLASTSNEVAIPFFSTESTDMQMQIGDRISSRGN